MTVNIDKAIMEAGDCGRYQLILATLLTIPAVFPSAFIAFSHVFVSAMPEHWCAVPELIEMGVPLHVRKNVSLPKIVRDGISRYSHCEMYNVNYSQLFAETTDGWPVSDPSWPQQPCQYGWEYDRTYYEETLVTKFDLVCDNDWQPSAAVSLFYAGSLIGTILFGWITDKYGRRLAFFSNLILCVTLPFASAFSPNYACYIFLRFLVGFTFPATFQTPFIIVMELTSPRYRTAFGMMLGMIWGLSMSALCGIAALLREWFSLLLCCSLPFTVLFTYWWIIPESPRWLVAQNRFDEAEEILQKIAKVNKECVPRKILHKYMTNGVDQNVENVHPMRLLRTSNMRKKTLLITLIWMANSVVYTGLSYMSANLGISDYLAFAISGLVEAPSCLLAWYAMEKWGRRWTTFITMLIVGLCCIGNVLVPEDHTLLNVLLPSIGKFGITGTFSIVYVFGGELLPTVVRGNGLAVCAFVCGCGLIASPYVIYLVVHSRVLPLLIMGFFSILGGLAAIFLPETLGTNLPQTMAEGEEFGKNMAILSCLPKRQPSSEAKSAAKNNSSLHIMHNASSPNSSPQVKQEEELMIKQ